MTNILYQLLWTIPDYCSPDRGFCVYIGTSSFIANKAQYERSLHMYTHDAVRSKTSLKPRKTGKHRYIYITAEALSWAT